MQRLEFSLMCGNRLKKFERVGDGHLQDVVDVFALVEDGEGFLVEALALCSARRSTHSSSMKSMSILIIPMPPQWGQEPSLTLKLKRPGLIPLSFTFGQLGEEIADLIEEFDVGGGIGAGSAADRRLVDGDHFVDLFDSFDRFMFADAQRGIVEGDWRGRIEDIGDERRFSRSRDAGDGDKHLERDFDRYIF